ncbi:MAG: hypothetical protein NVS3B20_04840 [Polyangiales bacterium]
MTKHIDDPTTRILEGTHPTMSLASVELTVVDGPDRGASLRLAPGTAHVGTAIGSHLRLTDTTVSRLHCSVHASRNGVNIVDEDSTNGTFLDGVRVHDAVLATGSVVRLGTTMLRVDFGEEPMFVQISSRNHFGAVIGSSVEMRRLYAIMERVALTEATVLIQGETGTGKELVARAVHDGSARAQGPFVAIDCGAIAENLIESELFGHVRGAFTGAIGDRKGLFEEAHGGTLFLDEIGELPPSLQPKLLRALESREVRPVGGNVSKRVDVRVLAASNRSLAQSVNDGSFREDLYYRLAVLELQLPPLRSRREDIPALAQHFFERFTNKQDPLPPELLASLLGRGWPGNVRELRNFVERSVSLGWSPGGRVVPDQAKGRLLTGLETLVPTHLPLKEARVVWTEGFERMYVDALLRKTNGNVTRAAEIAGVNRRSLQRLIAQLGIRPEGLRAGIDEDE